MRDGLPKKHVRFARASGPIVLRLYHRWGSCACCDFFGGISPRTYGEVWIDEATVASSGFDKFCCGSTTFRISNTWRAGMYPPAGRRITDLKKQARFPGKLAVTKSDVFGTFLRSKIYISFDEYL